MRGLILGAALLAAGAAPAQEAETWPCVQAKVPTLTPAAIWAGPPLENATDWAADPEVAALVGRLSQRRVPVEEAEAEVEAFADSLDGAQARDRLLRLFAGLFETMNAERSEVIDGIERYARKQIAMAESIREENSALGPAARGAGRRPRRRSWRRRTSSTGARASSTSGGPRSPTSCEVPRLIEQRPLRPGSRHQRPDRGGLARRHRGRASP